MKTIIRSAMIAFAISMFAIGSSFAATPQEEVNAAVQEAAQECSTGQITVTLDEGTGVATIAGSLDCALGKTAAEQAAKEFAYVKEVVNLITVN